MGRQTTAPMGWGTIVAITVVTGLVVGMTLGLLREAIGSSGGTAGVGASMGVVGALLISRRRLAIREQGGG